MPPKKDLGSTQKSMGGDEAGPKLEELSSTQYVILAEYVGLR